MILEIPFHYRAAYVERGLRNPYHAELGGVAAVRLREAETASVELAFAVADTSGLQPELASVNGRGRRILRHQGRFWRELMPIGQLQETLRRQWLASDRYGDDIEPGVEADRDLWKRLQPENPFWKNAPSPYTRIKTRADVEAASQRGVREWREDDGGAAASEELRRIGTGMMAVGGVAFEACHEPCWAITVRNCEEGVGREALVHVVWATPDDGGIEARLTHKMPGDSIMERRFALGRRDDAVCHAGMLRALWANIERVRVAGAARVLLPGADSLPDDCIALEDAASALLEACSRHLPTATRAGAAAWHALRDACEVSGLHPGGSPRPQASPSLAAALARAAEAWSDYRTPDSYGAAERRLLGDAAHVFSVTSIRHKSSRFNDDRHRQTGDEDEVEAARLALVRWEARPADGREWTCLASPAVADGSLLALEIATLHDARALARELGTNLDAEASAAADGRLRLVAVLDGNRLAAAFSADPDTDRLEALHRSRQTPPQAEEIALRLLGRDHPPALAPG